MLHIVVLTYGPFIPWTIASLLDKEDDFHLHLYTPAALWEQMKPIHDWAKKSFPRVDIRKTPWSSMASPNIRNIEARLVVQFRKEWWNKENDIDRVIFTTTGTTLFIQPTVDSGQIPTLKWMNANKKVAAFAQNFMYLNHPNYGKYYKMLGMDTEKQENHKFFMLNWREFLKIPMKEFFIGGQWRRQQKPDFTYYSDEDSFIMSASNEAMFGAIKAKPYSVAPVYFSGHLDQLIRKEAIGPKDCLNHNLLLRRCYALNHHAILIAGLFHLTPTLSYMATPFEPYERLIDKIPTNIRYAGLNELIITKSMKQKRFLRKALEAQYLMGKA